jgi:hypothetical protein
MAVNAKGQHRLHCHEEDGGGGIETEIEGKGERGTRRIASIVGNVGRWKMADYAKLVWKCRTSRKAESQGSPSLGALILGDVINGNTCTHTLGQCIDQGNRPVYLSMAGWLAATLPRIIA